MSDGAHVRPGADGAQRPLVLDLRGPSIDASDCPADAGERLRGLGLVAAGLVHDLANVCTVLVTQLDYVRDDPADHEALDVAGEAGRRVHAMLRDTRDFLRGTLAAHPEVDVPLLVRATLPWLRAVLGDRHLLTLTLPAGSLRARVAPLHLERMLVNLVRNAADAQPRGGSVRLHVAAAPYAAEHPHLAGAVPPGDWILVRVEDDGPGIPPAVAARLFEPLHTTKGDGEGTGLGLATAALNMRGHGGHVAVERAPSGGAAVTLYFPRLPDV